ncbi:MAG TPA: carboxyl transferase domain-containing protein [Conexibacter sp.]|nr:carboxyl transferase domain-containing protein [Conexibacter sp.]
MAAAPTVEAHTLRLGAAERIELLCDPGSVRTIRSAVASRRLGGPARSSDGVVAGSGTVAGRPIVCYAQDPTFAGGSLGEAHADTIVRVLGHAGDAGVPAIGLFASAGARVQEGTAALAGYARVFRAIVRLSGRVPQLSVVAGTCAGGGSYAPALTDFVVMTRSAEMFLTGPGVVREALGEDVAAQDLGGPGVHARTGVCQFVADDDVDAIGVVREVLSYLPQHAGAAPPQVPPHDPPPADPGALVPADLRRVYDVRDVARAIVDGGELCEVASRWARNIVTALARLEGHPVGIVANQPRHLGGAIDAAAAQKAARFVRLCDTYGIPLVVLVDTPGFLPGSGQERRAVIRHGAELLHAFAAARVPCVSVVTRQAYGGAYITMDSKDLGADFAFAWRDARIGVMGARHAVRIVHRREIEHALTPELRARELGERYLDEHQLAHASARDGFLDEVIEPGETRERVCAALALLRHGYGRRDARGTA